VQRLLAGEVEDDGGGLVEDRGFISWPSARKRSPTWMTGWRHGRAGL